MKKNELLKWVFTNALGLGIGFVALLQVGMVLEYGFDTDRYWKWGQPWDFSVSAYIFDLISLIVLGAIVGLAQTFVLKSHNVKAVPWILATVIGFGLVVIITWPLLYIEMGNIPGPVEPIIITIGGSSFAGVVQYFLLRKRGIIASKWLLLWIVGLILSLVPVALFFEFIGGPIGLSWPLEVFINGFLVGGVAAWISGKALFKVLSLD